MAQESGQKTQAAANDGSRTSAQEPAPQAERREAGEESQARGGAMTRQRGMPQQMARPFASSVTSPFSMMRRMMEDMDRMFADLGMGGMLSPMRAMGFPLETLEFPRRTLQVEMWSPQIEVSEVEGNLVIKADVPGLTMDDVQVALADGALTISGHRREEQREQRGSVSYSERSYGSFSRVIPVPEGVSHEDVDASFANGVLEVKVKLPEQSEARGRKIEIKSREGGR